MNTPLTTRLLAAITAASMTFMIVSGVVSLAEPTQPTHDVQLATASVKVAMAGSQAPAGR